MKDDTKKPEKSGKKSAADNLADAVDLLDEYRLHILYLKFDVEATRREREFWRKKAEGK